MMWCDCEEDACEKLLGYIWVILVVTFVVSISLVYFIFDFLWSDLHF